MGKGGITHRDDGRFAPIDEHNRTGWVSAGRGRNWFNDDPLLDWLDLYGEEHGYVRDDQLPGYDPELDFTQFIFAQGRGFEEAVLGLISRNVEVLRIGDGPEDSVDPAKAEETYDAMAGGVEAIHQGVLHDPEHRVYGLPDLLVRSDVLHRLVREAPLGPDEITIPAPGLPGARWHYVVVDVKFKSFKLQARGGLGTDHRANMAQVALYSRALGRIQGYHPPRAFLLGRSVCLHKQDPPSSRCDERLAAVRVDEQLFDADRACEWIRRARAEGGTWRVLPEPSVPELRPNMSNKGDSPWHAAKREIGAALEDVTLLWQVAPAKRDRAIAAGVSRWTDPRCNAALFGLGEKQAPILDRILEVHRNPDLHPVQPARIEAERTAWGQPDGVEFYVDFEWVSDLDDDFSKLPEKGGQNLIFMVGCGHEEAGEWRFECFTAARMDEPAEAECLDAWFEHMEAVRRRLAPATSAPLTFHWSHAERSSLETAYQSANRRHGGRWAEPNWFDFLKRVIKAEPVVVRGSMAFGLKAVANAMHAHGFIETRWGDGPADGMAAMVGAWRCAHDARQRGVPMGEHPLMGPIRDYNEVDCRVMWEIVRHLRRHH